MNHPVHKGPDPDKWRMPFEFWLLLALVLIGTLAHMVTWICNWLRTAIS